ncbi:Nucleoporin seh1-A [Aphelenchoides besseyi]|nr:Nucleoporin seh1-A [Aphelenchoides besseyi]KAI6200910.1 Nucleoporin seh1-A [Aphelenchoides besseyi]
MSEFDYFPVPPSLHRDVITHVEMNSDGTLLATCSTDKVVNLFERKDREQGWKKLDSIKSHGGFVSKVRFCHPFRGRILLTCSFDTKVHVFQEDAVDGYGWKRRTILNCNNMAITDAQFCPYHIGLMIAICTSSGFVMVFEAPDPLNLTVWNAIYEIQLGHFRISTITWDRSRFLSQPILFVGSDDSQASANFRTVLLEIIYNRQFINQSFQFELDASELVKCSSFAPSASPTYSRLAIGTQTSIYIYAVIHEKSNPNSRYQPTRPPRLIGKLDSNGLSVVAIKWNRQGSSLAVQYEDGSIHIYQQMFNFCWKKMGTVDLKKE